MPADHRFGLHEHEDIEPARPDRAKRDPEQPVGSQDPWAATAVGESRELLPEREVLEREFSAAAEGRADCWRALKTAGIWTGSGLDRGSARSSAHRQARECGPARGGDQAAAGLARRRDFLSASASRRR